MTEIETLNKFLVAAGADGIVFLKPVPQNIGEDDGLLLAAYLVALADKDGKFAAVLHAVQNA